MIVGQDCSDDLYYEIHKGVEDWSNRTNINLVTLLGSIGIPISMPGERLGRGQVFFTNAILCLKQGGMQAPVRDEWFQNCGTSSAARLGGEACLTGTRVPGRTLIDYIEGGHQLTEFLADFPDVSRQRAIAVGTRRQQRT